MVPELHKENLWYIWCCGSFIDNFILLMNELPIQHRILIMNDFNLDYMLPENVTQIMPLIQNFNLLQHLQYSTHIHGNIGSCI